MKKWNKDKHMNLYLYWQFSAGTRIWHIKEYITEKPMEVYYLDKWLIITLFVAGLLIPAIFHSLSQFC